MPTPDPSHSTFFVRSSKQRVNRENFRDDVKEEWDGGVLTCQHKTSQTPQPNDDINYSPKQEPKFNS